MKGSTGATAARAWDRVFGTPDLDGTQTSHIDGEAHRAHPACIVTIHAHEVPAPASAPTWPQVKLWDVGDHSWQLIPRCPVRSLSPRPALKDG